MKVTLEKQDKNIVHLAVEIGSDVVDRAWEKAYRHLCGHVMIPGFRKGKAPRPLVERHVGQDAMRREALEVIVPETYTKAVEEIKLEPIAQPQVVDVSFEKGQPATITYLVEVRPDVKLGAYLGLAVSPPSAHVTDEAFDKALENVLLRKATVETVERAVAEGDVVVVDFEGRVDGVGFDGGKATNFTVEVAPGRFIPGFTEALLGLTAGQHTHADLTFPAEYANADLVGKTAAFDFNVKEVRERRLPDLTDELAKEFGLDGAEALRAKVREELQTEAEEQSEIEGRKQLLDQIVTASEMELSEVMVKREIYYLLEQHFNQLQRQGVNVSQLFNEQNRADWESRFEPEAIKRIRTSLTLGAIARQEGIEVETEEMSEAMVEYANMAGREPRQFQQELINNGRYAALADEVLSNKIIEWLYERAEVEGRPARTETGTPAEPTPATAGTSPPAEHGAQ